MFDDIAPNAEAFAKQLAEIDRQLKRDANLIIKKVLVDLLRALKNDTPKDTCRAAGSWMLDTTYSDWVLPPGDYTGTWSANTEQLINSLPDSDQYVLYNNIEYITTLENGHSQQAPNGFIAMALGSIASFLAKRAAERGWA